MPMQDAKFQAGSLIHAFGKAIFVFAGGTRYDFQSFEQAHIDNRGAKAPDFISRLRGYVNIKGPNPVGQYSALIRRAILLRSFLERFYGHLLDEETGVALLSESVAQGFLRVKRYLHGARSLEAIVHTSALPGAHYFGVSELPPADLLRLHVTPDFSERVASAQLNAPLIETIAKEMHEQWKQEREKNGWTYGEPRDDEKKIHPMLKPYEKLSEPQKELNRQPARLTQAKLDEVGFRIVPISRSARRQARPLGKDDLARLMRIEHDIWLRARLLEGFDWAKKTNPRLRLHLDLLPFDQLAENEQNLDRGNTESTLKVLRTQRLTLSKIDRA
jgi:hypothetical protein